MRFWKDNGTIGLLALTSGAFALLVWVMAFFQSFPSDTILYSNRPALATSTAVASVAGVKPAFTVTHIPTPSSVKAIYMTSWAAGNDKFRKRLFDLIEKTEINSVVIDVKDYTGHISFPVDDPDLVKIGSAEKRIPDIKEFIGRLHEKGVYVIARISSFQDSFLINVHPEWAVKTKEGGIWQDRKGVKWLDAGAEPVWKYLVSIGRESYSVGFDELNFDYIRYPSDGNMKDISYAWSDGRTREAVMESFFQYLHGQFASSSIPLSADVFGLTTSASDDLGIGQNLLSFLKYFDYVAPMVYPSHFSNGFMGFAKPAEHPYDVIKYSMDHAVTRAINASTSPEKLRPWLQAFDLGAVYTPAMVQAQIQATYDSGLNSWMLWDAASVYNEEDVAPSATITAPIGEHSNASSSAVR